MEEEKKLYRIETIWRNVNDSFMKTHYATWNIFCMQEQKDKLLLAICEYEII